MDPIPNPNKEIRPIPNPRKKTFQIPLKMFPSHIAVNKKGTSTSLSAKSADDIDSISAMCEPRVWRSPPPADNNLASAQIDSATVLCLLVHGLITTLNSELR